MIQDTSHQDRALTPKNRSYRRIIPLLALTLVALTGGYYLYTGNARAGLVIPKAQIQLATVERGDLVRDIAVQGQIVAANAPVLYSQQNGHAELLKQPGENVSNGEVLAIITSPELQSDVQQQRAALNALLAEAERAILTAREQQLDMQQVMNNAQVNLLAARRELQRARQSIEMGVIRTLDLDIAKDNLTKAELEFEHASQKVELSADTLSVEKRIREQDIERQRLVLSELERKLDALQIRAPVTGQMGNWLVGQQSHVISGQALMTVIDLSQYEAELTIPENYSRELAPGQQVEVSLGNQQLSGAISHIAPEVRNNQISARVRFELADNTQLRQNQRLSARIILAHKSNVLKIRRGEFISSGGGRRAYQVINDQALRKPVELGVLSVQWVEILSGASEGEQWVISGLSEFKDEPRVNLD